MFGNPEPKSPHPFLLPGRGRWPDPAVRSAADWLRHLTESGVCDPGERRPPMSAVSMPKMTTNAHFDRFLAEAIAADQEAGPGLGPDALYGLYTSWCLITHSPTAPPKVLFRALKDLHGISPTSNALAMTGPAATDYILASAPNVI